MTLTKTAAIFAATSGALAVALGAFGAHALEALLVSRGSEGTWDTAALYHLTHALALLAITRPAGPRGTRVPGWTLRLWMAGPVVFSGSLYLLAIGAPRFIAWLTPLGGLALLIGWVLLAISFAKAPPDESGS